MHHNDNFSLESTGFGKTMPDEVFGQITSRLSLHELGIFAATSKAMKNKIQGTEEIRTKIIAERKQEFEKIRVTRTEAFFGSIPGAIFAVGGTVVFATVYCAVNGSITGAVAGMAAYVVNRAIENPWISGPAGMLAGTLASRLMNKAANTVIHCIFPETDIAFDRVANSSSLVGMLVGYVNSKQMNMVSLTTESCSTVYEGIGRYLDYGFVVSGAGGGMLGFGMTLSSGSVESFLGKASVPSRLNLFAQTVAEKKEKQVNFLNEIKIQPR